MENRKSKRSLRVALVLGAAVAGTALVGWGGLAAWSAYTENAGNSVAAGTLRTTTTSAPTARPSIGGAPGGAGPGWCSAVHDRQRRGPGQQRPAGHRRGQDRQHRHPAEHLHDEHAIGAR